MLRLLICVIVVAFGSTLNVDPPLGPEYDKVMELYKNKHVGKKLKIITRDDNVGAFMTKRAGNFSKLSGAEVTVGQYSWEQLVKEITTSLATGTEFVDAYFVTASDLSTFPADRLLPLNDLIEQDEQLVWNDIGTWYRTHGTFNGHVVHLPADGDFHVLYYRKDILSAKGLSPPRTLEELIEVSKAINGTDMDGDGNGDVGFCIGLQDGTQSFMLLSLILPFIQSKGKTQGYIFDPQTMNALQNNEALIHAFKLIARLLAEGSSKHIWSNLGWDAREFYVSGKCGLYIDWGDILSLSFSSKSSINGKLGIAKLPGSKEVWDRDLQELRPCDPNLCPFMDTDGINYAIFAYGGWGLMINGQISKSQQQLAFDFGSYIMGPTISKLDVVDGSTGMNPFRYSHLESKMWLDAGLLDTSGTTVELIEAVTEALSSSNIDIGRLPGYHDIRRNYYDALMDIMAGVDGSTVVSQLNDKNNQIIETEGGKEKLLPLYRSALGLPAIQNEGTSINVALVVAVSLGGFFFLTIIAAYFLTAKQRRIRALYNDKVIAEKTAEAIATMRLEDLDYLRDIPYPTRMQSNFIKILDTITELRSFLPKSLLGIDNDEDTEYETNSEINTTAPSTTAPSQSSFSSRGEVLLKSQLDCLTHRKSASVMRISVDQLHSERKTGITERVGWLASEVVSVAELQKGVAEFTGLGDIMVTFNCSYSCIRPTQHAANAGAEVMRRAKGMFDIRIALATSSVLVGTVGSQQMKKHHTFGKATAMSCLMQLSQRFPFTKYPMITCPVSRTSIELFHITVPMCIEEFDGRRVMFSAYVGPKADDSVEWLYSIGTQEGLSESISTAWNELLQGNTEPASSLTTASHEKLSDFEKDSVQSLSQELALALSSRKIDLELESLCS